MYICVSRMKINQLETLVFKQVRAEAHALLKTLTTCNANSLIRKQRLRHLVGVAGGGGDGRRAAGGGRRRLLLLLVLGMCCLLRGVGAAGSAGGGAVGMGHAAAVVAWRHALRRMVALHSRGGNIDKLTWLQTGFFFWKMGLSSFFLALISFFFSSSCKKDASGRNLASSWIKTAAYTA